MNQEDKNTSTYLDFLVNVDKKFGEKLSSVGKFGEGAFMMRNIKWIRFEGNFSRGA